MKYLTLILITFVFLSCQENQKPSTSKTDKESFSFATWTNPGGEFDKEKWEAKLEAYDSLGISEILVGGNPEFYNQLIPLASEKNIKVHAWMWTLNRPGDTIANKHPE